MEVVQAQPRIEVPERRQTVRGAISQEHAPTWVQVGGTQGPGASPGTQSRSGGGLRALVGHDDGVVLSRDDRDLLSEGDRSRQGGLGIPQVAEPQWLAEWLAPPH